MHIINTYIIFCLRYSIVRNTWLNIYIIFVQYYSDFNLEIILFFYRFHLIKLYIYLFRLVIYYINIHILWKKIRMFLCYLINAFLYNYFFIVFYYNYCPIVLFFNLLLFNHNHNIKKFIHYRKSCQEFVYKKKWPINAI